MNIYACKKKTEKITHTHSYCGSKKSVVGFVVDTELVELFGSFIVVWLTFISFEFPGFFITVTRPPYSSNRNGVVLLLAQINSARPRDLIC
jgi:hypothetical protein